MPQPTNVKPATVSSRIEITLSKDMLYVCRKREKLYLCNLRARSTGAGARCGRLLWRISLAC